VGVIKILSALFCHLFTEAALLEHRLPIFDLLLVIIVLTSVAVFLSPFLAIQAHVSFALARAATAQS
jgi:hypothetical protein